MNYSVATTTFYRDMADLRLAMAVKTLTALKNQGTFVAVIDGSPDPIKDTLQATGAHIIDEPTGWTMGAGRRLALYQASVVGSVDVIVWMEPEKYTLVPYLDAICEPIVANDADIVIPRRADDLASYPKLQRLAEQTGNAVFERVTGLNLDVWIGPRAIGRGAALRHFLDYSGAGYGDKWHSIFMPLLTAIKAGLRLAEVVVDYQHPAEQTAAESSDIGLGILKRLEQLSDLGTALTKQGIALGLIS